MSSVSLWATRHLCPVVGEEGGGRPADDLRAADHDDPSAGERYLVVLEDLEHRESGGRHEGLLAVGQQVGIDRARAVDILGRVHQPANRVGIEVGRDRIDDHDPGHGWIRVQGADGGGGIGQVHVVREADV